MGIKTVAFDPAEFLDTREAQAAYLSEALAEGDPAAFRRAVAVIARAQGMAKVARQAEVNRESLYRSLGDGGNPSFETVVKVVRALDLRLQVAPAEGR